MVSYSASGHHYEERSYLNANKFPAISAPNRRFDDFVVGDEHVQVGDREQSQANTGKIEYVLDKHSVSSVRIRIPGLEVSSHSYGDRVLKGDTHPHAKTSAPSSLACLRVL